MKKTSAPGRAVQEGVVAGRRVRERRREPLEEREARRREIADSHAGLLERPLDRPIVSLGVAATSTRFSSVSAGIGSKTIDEVGRMPGQELLELPEDHLPAGVATRREACRSRPAGCAPRRRGRRPRRASAGRRRERAGRLDRLGERPRASGRAVGPASNAPPDNGSGAPPRSRRLGRGARARTSRRRRGGRRRAAARRAGGTGAYIDEGHLVDLLERRRCLRRPWRAPRRAGRSCPPPWRPA